MVAWANDRIEDGHLPLDGWYPDLSLGSSRFHHYQSLPHILTGYLAVPLGPERAVSLTLYLLLATWPIAVYAGGRLMTWGRWPCAMAAAMSGLLVSEPGVRVRVGELPVAGLRHVEPALGHVAPALRVGARLARRLPGQGVRRRLAGPGADGGVPPDHRVPGPDRARRVGDRHAERAPAPARPRAPRRRRGVADRGVGRGAAARRPRLDDPGRVLPRQALLRLVRREADHGVVRERRAVRPLPRAGDHRARRRRHLAVPAPLPARRTLTRPAARRAAFAPVVLRTVDARAGVGPAPRFGRRVPSPVHLWRPPERAVPGGDRLGGPRRVGAPRRSGSLGAPAGRDGRGRDRARAAGTVTGPRGPGPVRGDRGAVDRRAGHRGRDRRRRRDGAHRARARRRPGRASTRACVPTGGPSTRSARSRCTRSC